MPGGAGAGAERAVPQQHRQQPHRAAERSGAEQVGAPRYRMCHRERGRAQGRAVREPDRCLLRAGQRKERLPGPDSPSRGRACRRRRGAPRLPDPGWAQEGGRGAGGLLRSRAEPLRLPSKWALPCPPAEQMRQLFVELLHRWGNRGTLLGLAVPTAERAQKRWLLSPLGEEALTACSSSPPCAALCPDHPACTSLFPSLLYLCPCPSSPCPSWPSLDVRAACAGSQAALV